MKVAGHITVDPEVTINVPGDRVLYLVVKPDWDPGPGLAVHEKSVLRNGASVTTYHGRGCCVVEVFDLVFGRCVGLAPSDLLFIGITAEIIDLNPIAEA